MPRKPRIEIAGFYHIVNRGVEQRVVFKEKEDYEKFETLMCMYAKNHRITIHNYCLMSNHYHLLIEITQPNLSKFMRQLNMNYAIYFNKKYKRTGHLWQGRYKSWYVTDEAYLYSLMLYIEQNPLKADIVPVLEKYPYSSYSHFLDTDNVPECLADSWVVRHYRDDTEAIRAFLNSKIDASQLEEMKKAASLVEAPDTDNEPDMDKLRRMFEEVNERQERNRQIVHAYQQGYSQHRIAKVLGLNQATVQRIIKRTKM